MTTFIFLSLSKKKKMDENFPQTNNFGANFYRQPLENANYYSNVCYSNTVNKRDEDDEEERISLSSTKQISFELRQPSFISLTGLVITKGGEEIGSSTNQDSLSTLDMINLQNNDGQFENPILVIENTDYINANKYPDQRQNSFDHFHIPQKKATNFSEVQTLTAQRLRSRNMEFWKQIGYFPN